MTPAEIDAHFELMRVNLHSSLIVAATVTLIWAAIWEAKFLQALLLGGAILSITVIYLNGWPYFRVFFFQDALRFTIRVGVVCDALIAAALAGLGLRRLLRLVR